MTTTEIWTHALYLLSLVFLVWLFTARLKALSTMLSESHKERLDTVLRFEKYLDESGKRERQLHSMLGETQVQNDNLRRIVKRQDKFITSQSRSWNKNLKKYDLIPEVDVAKEVENG